ncbi:hypothetical protein DFH06DRAFT_1470995 [Mycena polygramma]|nr:hypothetical protein DFH06DRAFT_1470995 [Mycena polygramma]
MYHMTIHSLVFVLVAPAASPSGIQSPTGYGPIAPLLIEDHHPPLLIVRCYDQHPVFATLGFLLCLIATRTFRLSFAMVKPSDIKELEGAENYWTWLPDARAMLLTDGTWNAVDPLVPVPNGAVQMRNWADQNAKAHGALFLTLSRAVKDKVSNSGIGVNGRLLWATLESYYTTADAATRSILMSQFHSISHDLSKPADTFLQAVVTAERRLTAIAASLPAHMVQDKILSGLSSAYSSIITLLQVESPQRDVPSMINAINAWERADLQRADSVIKAARAARVFDDTNQGGEFAAAHLSRSSRHADSSHTHSHSRSSAGKDFDWTNTKNRTDVCYRCGLPGHFAQYCVSVMPDDVRRRIVRDREQRAHAAEAEQDSDSTNEASNHAMAAVLDLPTELHIDSMDPDVREAWLSTLGPDALHPVPQLFTNVAGFSAVDPDPSPPSPPPTASSVTSTPSKKKKKKKKKKSATVSEVQAALEGMSLQDDEDEFSM